MQDTKTYYNDLYTYTSKQLGISIEDAKNLYDIDWNNYANATGYKISATEDWIDSFDETLASELLGINTLDEAQWTFE
jgi:hypothetical protein